MIMLVRAISSRSVFIFEPEYASSPPAAANATPDGERRLSPYAAIEPPVIKAPQRRALLERSSLVPGSRQRMLSSSFIGFPLQVGFMVGCITNARGARQSRVAIRFCAELLFPRLNRRGSTLSLAAQPLYL